MAAPSTANSMVNALSNRQHNTAPGSGPAPKIPQLFKWIKHRASKKDSSYKSSPNRPSFGGGNSCNVKFNSKNNPVDLVLTGEDIAGSATIFRHDETTDLVSGLTSISKETMLSSESSTISGDTNQDSSTDTTVTTCSGNTIVSDSSYDVTDNKTGYNSQQHTQQVVVPNHMATILSSGNIGIISSANGIHSYPSTAHNNHSTTKVTTPQSTSKMGVVKTQSTPFSNSTNHSSESSVNAVRICKHGSMINRCRMCMQLPPLPPGSERVLRELQREAKHRLRSQSQINLSSSSNNSSTINNNSDILASPVLQRNNHRLLHTQLSLEEQSLSNPHSHYGFVQNHQNVRPALLEKSDIRSHSSPRSVTTSPEHLYEEIPNSFFHGSMIGNRFHQPVNNFLIGGGGVQKSSSTGRMYLEGSKQNPNWNNNKYHTEIMHVNNNSVNNTTMNYDGNSINNNINYNGRSKSMRGFSSTVNNNNNNTRLTCDNGASTTAPSKLNTMQLRSHEFYPQNMHCRENKQNSPSRQVSLGNLDFGMAKECDGFLVVPLRDRGSNSDGSSAQPIQGQTQHNQQSIVENNAQNYWVSDKQQNGVVPNGINMNTNTQNYHKDWLRVQQQQHTTAVTTSNGSANNAHTSQQHWVRSQQSNDNTAMTNRAHDVNSHQGANQNHVGNDNHFQQPIEKRQQPVFVRHSGSYHHIANHHQSDSGFHEGRNNSSNLELANRDYNLYMDNNSGQQYPQHAIADQTLSYHGRTHSVDVVGYEPTEKFTHCKKCNRPHALYHGVSVCHSHVEDMTHELQYLDIAGLERDKLRGTSSVLSSPSLLQNFNTRRSAFSKYIPVSTHQNNEDSNEDNNKDELQDDIIPTVDCAIEDYNESEILLSDSYKRQSMSAESDYFSSNYNTSQSDNVSGTSHEFQAGNQENHARTNSGNYVTGSDKSNDTFSEYDIQHKGQDSGTSTEYDFYLAKVQENLRIKQEVKRIIRSSESEGDNYIPDDSISLTSVTSLSELSTMPMDDSASFVRSRVHHSRTNNKGSPKSSKTSHSKLQQQQQQSVNTPIDAYVLKMQRVRKPIRKKRKQPQNTSTKGVEYYKLPDFPGTQTNFQQPNSSAQENRSPKFASKAMTERSLTPPEKQDTASCYSLDSIKSSDSNKLSCRVTDFRLGDISSVKRGSSFSSRDSSNNSSSGASSGNKVFSVRATGIGTGDMNGNGDSKTGNIMSSRSSVYSSHNQVKNSANNRLLSDLMRRNHDRQLFSLI